MTRLMSFQPLLLTLVLALFAMTASVYADVPNVVSYQGRLTDDAGQPINGSILLKFKIYGSEAGDDSLWSSNFRTVQVDEGLFKYDLGSNVPLPEDLFSGNPTRYLGITVDTDAEIQPRTRFLAFPYANKAENADSADYAIYAATAGSVDGIGWIDVGDTVKLEDPYDVVVVGSQTLESIGKLTAGGGWAHGAFGYDSSGVFGFGRDYMSGAMGMHEHGDYGKLGSFGTGVAGYSLDGGSGVFGKDLASGVYGRLGYSQVGLQAGVMGVVSPGSGDNKFAGWFNGDVNFNYNVSIKTGGERAEEDLVIGKNLGSWGGHRLVIGDDDTGVGTGLVIGETSDTRCWMLWDVDDNYFSIGNISEGYNWGNILTMRGPFLGVGTLNPTEELYVAGDICYTGTIGACSDRRYKQNVSTLTGALDKVSQMRGVSFNWRKDEYPEQKFSDKPQVGFIAQELQEILPEVVSEDNDGYYNIDYGKIAPLLVEAIKDQQQQIDALTQRIAELEGTEVSGR